MGDVGVFDLLNPLFYWVDQFLQAQFGFAKVLRMGVFAGFGSAASMWLFKIFSNQNQLAELKLKISNVQKELTKTDGNTSDLKHNIQLNLQLTGKQLWLSLWPALLACLPVLFLLSFSSHQYGALTPDAGFRVYVTPVGYQSSPSDFEWQGVNAQWDARKKAWTFYQPEPGSTARLMLFDQQQFIFPVDTPADVVHKKRWWNFLFANPAGYLDDQASVELFELNAPQQIVINWGPGWMRGWLFAFLLYLIVFSVAIKIIFKIH